ncbi:MAG: ferrochelatase [Gammaproteobacteria bacterium]
MPRYAPESVAARQQPPATGILLANLGTPDAPTPAALRRYLAEFLFDPRVIERPRLQWWLILHGIILRVRPRKASHAYRKVWTSEGSPLLAISRRQEAGLRAALEQRLAGPVNVELAMRYGSPSIRSALERLKAVNAQRVLVLPLYPQYSATTTASTLDAVSAVLRTWRVVPELRMISAYYAEDGYIRALADSVRRYWAEHGRGDRLLFSFHGLPKRYADAGDPYGEQCLCTANCVADALQLPADRWQVTFQSRFGPEEWLQPYTDKTLEQWGADGVGRVDVMSPGFAADCLETLEEGAMANRELFLAAGGKDYHYIPALNDDPAHIEFLADLVVKHCGGWPAGDSSGGDQ